MHARALSAPQHTANHVQHAASKRRCVLAAPPRATPAPHQSTTEAVQVSFKRLLLPILDANHFLGEGSKTAVATAAVLAQAYQGTVTVLVIAEPGTTSSDPEKQIDTISWHLRDRGLEDYSFLQRNTTQPASVLIGDVADEVEADLVVVASEAVHAKHVDANQLAEFVACPLLVVP